MLLRWPIIVGLKERSKNISKRIFCADEDENAAISEKNI